MVARWIAGIGRALGKHRAVRRPRRLQLEALEVRSLLTGGIVVTDTEIRAQHDTVPRFVGQDAIYSLASGDWSDPLIWSTNQVPGSNDQVRISAGTSVIYDVFDQQKLDAVEVMGRLEFATDQSTSLYLNELTVLPGAALIVGTAAQPVPPQFTAEIVFTDTPDAFGNHFKTGTVDHPGIDPFQYGNGLLVFDGEVTMHGAPLSETFVRLAEEPKSGDQTLTLENAVTGWKPGDQLVIPDTRHINPVDVAGYYTYEPQWEEVTVAAIDGTTITLAQPLLFDHLGARDADGSPTILDDGTKFLPHVANLTRNVVLRSENPDGVRGHTMFLARTAKDIRYVQFQDLGRTEASAIDSTKRNQVHDHDHDMDGQITHIGTNQVGRYSDHNHHLWGPEGGLPAPPDQYRDSYQLIQVGNSFTGGLKWGTAVHDTHYGLFRDNVYYDMDGSAIATEDGSEFQNEFLHNFVVRTNGGGGEFNGLGEANVDAGDQGDAFWFAGPFNIVEDNVAANQYRNGFVVFPDNIPNTRSLSIYQDVVVPTFPGADLHDPQQRNVVNVREFGQRDFSRNEVYGATTAAVHFWTVGDQTNFPETATPNVVHDMRVWHVTGVGIRFYYAAAYQVDGWVHRGDPQMIGASVADGAAINPSTGSAMVHAGAWAAYSEVRHADIQGMEIGYLNRGRGVADDIVFADSFLDNLINIGVRKFSQTPIDGSLDFLIQNVKFGDSLNPGSGNTVVMVGQAPELFNLHVPETHTIADFNGIEGQNFRIFYEEQAPDFVMPNGSCGDATDITNQQCWDLYGRATAGELAPTWEQDGDLGELGSLRARALGISGLAYETAETRLQSPRLYVNFEQQSDVKTAYFAVTGNPAGVQAVRLRIGDVEWTSDELIGKFDVSDLRNGSYNVLGTLLDANGHETGEQTTFDLLLPVKDRSQFRHINQAPVFDALASQEITANHLLRITLSAEDPEGDTVTYSSSSLPEGAMLDPTSGVLEWTPTNAQVGKHVIQVTASDGRLNRNAAVNVNVFFDANADGGRLGDWDFENVSAGVLPDTSLYGHHGTIHGGTNIFEGGLSFDGIDDFVQLPMSAALEPVQALTVALRIETSRENYFRPLVAYDSGSVASFGISVFDNGYANRFGEVGQGFWIQWNTESNGPKHLFVPFDDWSGQVDVALTFENTETSGELRFYVNEVERAVDLDAGRNIRYTPWGSQTVQFARSANGFWKGNLASAKLFGRALAAAEVQGLFGNKPPVIDPVPSRQASANQLITLDFNATDPEGDVVTFAGTGLPAGALLDPQTGEFRWTPTIEQVGSHVLTVVASDGRSSSSQQTTIAVSSDLLGDWNAANLTNGELPDSSPKNHAGTVFGGAGLANGALQLDGVDDFVQLPPTTDLQPVDELTVAIRFETSGLNYFTPLVAYDGGSVPSFGIRVLDRGHSSNFGEVGQGFLVQINTQSQGPVALYVPFREWTGTIDVALTFRNTETSGELRFFVNGVELGSNLAAGHDIRYTPWGSQTIQFGKSPAGFWRGSLYGAKLFGRALSAGEIANLF